MLARYCSWRFRLTVVILTTTLAAAAFTGRRRPDFLSLPLETIPTTISGWIQVGSQSLTPSVLSKLLPTAYLSRTYQKGDQQAGLFIAFYAQQRAGENMHSPKNCLPGSGWEIWQQGSAYIPVNGQQVKVNKYRIQNSGQRMLIFYWYQSRHRIIASEYLGKLLLVRDALVNGYTAGSIVRLSLPDLPTSTEQGISFATALIPMVHRCFGN